MDGHSQMDLASIYIHIGPETLILKSVTHFSANLVYPSTLRVTDMKMAKISGCAKKEMVRHMKICPLKIDVWPLWVSQLGQSHQLGMQMCSSVRPFQSPRPPYRATA